MPTPSSNGSNSVLTAVAPRRFVLDRSTDETGVSGEGIVAWGIEFPDGRTVTQWCGDSVHQTSMWNSLADVECIHGHGGQTRVRWIDQRWNFIYEDDLSE